MAKITLNYRNLYAPCDCIEEASRIFEEYANLSEAERFFSAEEIAESKKAFIADLMNGNKETYINFIIEQINEISGDFEYINQYETLKKRIESF